MQINSRPDLEIPTATIQNKHTRKHIFPSAASWHRTVQVLGVNGDECLFSERDWTAVCFMFAAGFIRLQRVGFRLNRLVSDSYQNKKRPELQVKIELLHLQKILDTGK